MKATVLAGLALILAQTAVAQEMKPPQVTLATVDWVKAAADLPGQPTDAAAAFATLNAASDARFPGIGQSAVPVLLPFDAEAAGKAAAPAEPDDRFVRGGFHATKFFLAGPSGYDTAFALRTAEVPELGDIRYREPIYVLFSGLGMLYELDGPSLPEGEPVKELDDQFPGIRRYLHESYVRYSFDRYGATYVAAIYCQDRRPRPKILTCRQADRVIVRFLNALALSGGTPGPARDRLQVTLPKRPATVSPDFSYFSPGFLIPGTGLKKAIGGRADYTVYADLRFPLKEAPAFANSQSFNNWGDCDFTGRSRRSLHKKGVSYSCNVNGLPLVFDESAGRNYSYPWRDNFCEHRSFYVGQCPGGEGHQGQDIRPGSCTLLNEGADRCQPYRHEVVAAHDGLILRSPKQEAVYLFIDTPDTHVRLRYMHMNPKQLDEDGILSGKKVAQGDVLGKVGNYNNFERGTTYHLHFDMQVPTKAGWVFVSPYMTLVSAYERLIGARGTEIKDGDTIPPLKSVPPIISHPEPVPVPPVAVPAAATEENAAVSVKPRKNRHVRHRRHHRHDDE